MSERLIGNPLFENQLMSYKQAAEFLGMSEAHLRRLKARGEVPYVQIGPKGVRFKCASLCKWIETREVK
jgi:excisionase family DNA binding protein